jgi:hypothetical protein
MADRREPCPKAGLGKISAGRQRLPFDTLGPPAYIPRPRRPPGLILRAALFLWHNESSCQRRLFDIVIRGRGTWAAARSRPAGESLQAKPIEHFRTLAFFSNKT